jgi:hypothetical protein
MSPISVSNTFGKIIGSKFIQKNVFEFARKNPAGFAARSALVSALSKDAVNCYYYTTQSWNNKKIPEDKRSFVGSMDLMNGILNVAGQMVVGKWIEKKAPKWFESIVGSKLTDDKTREYSTRIAEFLKDPQAAFNKSNKVIKFLYKTFGSKLGKMEAHPEITSERIEKYIIEKKILGTAGAKFLWFKVGFSALTTLFGTQIFCKRVLTPFLATPLAGWFSKRRDEKIAAKAAGKSVDKSEVKNDNDKNVNDNKVAEVKNETVKNATKQQNVFSKIASK